MNNLEQIKTQLNSSIKSFIDTKESTISKFNRIIVPKWNMAIETDIVKKEPISILEYYTVICPEWDRDFTDYTVSTGETTDEIIKNATVSFGYSLLTTLEKYHSNTYFSNEQSYYGRGIHNWKSYVGDILRIGNAPTINDPYMFWNALKDGILKRLGNQKMCFIKIYGAKIRGGKFVGECRINDIVSDELSNIVSQLIRQWDNESIGAIKQYIILKQNDETYIQYPYTKQDIIRIVIDSLVAFESTRCKGGNKYYQKLSQIIHDPYLLWEIQTFIPEICADLAYKDVRFPESFLFTGNFQNGMIKCYITQFASYSWIKEGVVEAMKSSFINNPKKVFDAMLKMSSFNNAYLTAKDNPSATVSSCIAFMPPDMYIFR